jgi:hypothetical protein
VEDREIVIHAGQTGRSTGRSKLERLWTKQQKVRREREAVREVTRGVVPSSRPLADAGGSKKECSQWSNMGPEIICCVVAA